MYSSIKITGNDGKFPTVIKDVNIYLGNSGTSSRFLLTFIALLPKDSEVVFEADDRLSKRPIKSLIDCLESNELIKVEYLKEGMLYPMKVTSLGNRENVKEMNIDCSETSQFVSSLILCAPMFGKNEVIINLEGKIVSSAYIHTSIAVMKEFGARVAYADYTKFIVVKSCGYDAEFDSYAIECDMSTAAYDIAYSAIFGQPIQLMHLGLDCMQGEIEFLNILRKHFGGFMYNYDDEMSIKGTKIDELYEIDLKNDPEDPHHTIYMLEANDSFIALSVVIALKLPKGTVVHITGIGNQRIKECNRIEKCVQILNSFHVIAYELEDGIAIIANPSITKMCYKTIVVPTYEDHRLAMAFAIMGAAVSAKNEVIIKDARTVEKTFPEFWSHIEEKYNLLYSGYIPKRIENCTKSGCSMNTMVLIGMRNSGKSMLAHHLAESGGFKEICLDTVFEEKYKTEIKDFIKEYGWEDFRGKET